MENKIEAKKLYDKMGENMECYHWYIIAKIQAKIAVDEKISTLNIFAKKLDLMSNEFYKDELNRLENLKIQIDKL